MATPRPHLGHQTLARDAGRRSSLSVSSLFAATVACLAMLACGNDAQQKDFVAPTRRANVVSTQTAKSNILYGLYSDVSWYNDATYRSQSIATAKALHTQVVRVDLLWEWIEYKRNHRTWTVIDDVVNQLTAAGIRPLLVVAGSPPWAAGVSEAKDENFYLYVPTDSVKFRTWVSQYTDFITAVAQRYKGKVTMWEIGNEPNDADFWKPAPNVAQYATWYIALRSAIKGVDPTSLVALGGLNGLGYDMDPPGMRGTAFLTALYALHVYPDIVAIHPYSNVGQSPAIHLNGADNFDDIAVVHNLMVANGQGSIPLWVTEWGWSVDKVTPAQQADYLGQSLALLDSAYASYVTVATYYSEFDPSSIYHYGLYTEQFTPRPAAGVFQTFMSTR
jgi:hypothetical protein